MQSFDPAVGVTLSALEIVRHTSIDDVKAHSMHSDIAKVTEDQEAVIVGEAADTIDCLRAGWWAGGILLCGQEMQRGGRQ